MIKWHYSQKPMIWGILSSGNLCLTKQFLYKLLETASAASDLRCLKIQVIWGHAASNWMRLMKSCQYKIHAFASKCSHFFELNLNSFHISLWGQACIGAIEAYSWSFWYQDNSKTKFESFDDTFRNILGWPQNSLGGQISRINVFLTSKEN